MKFSKKFIYALEIMHAINAHAGNPVSNDNLAQITKITYPNVMRVTNTLKLAGLIEAQIGRGGGYVLTQEGRNATLLKVYVHVEEKLDMLENTPHGHIHEEALENAEKAFAMVLCETKLFQ